MDYEFPKEFDLIVVGTGVVESILSAAASRVGKRVLQIDENDYYGGQWASFSLESIIKSKHHKKDYGGNESETNLLRFGNDLVSLKNIAHKFHMTSNNTLEEETDKIENEEQPKENKWTEENLLKLSRKFNIDLYPKLQYARGDFVELLISSNIARYCEYRSVSRILIWFNNRLESLPCSRSDVFANTKVSVVEKRMLMKLLTSLNDKEKHVQNYENKTFKEFLTDKKLTPNLIHYVLYGISSSSDDTSCEDGIEKARRFLNSLGRFGNTPFLFSLYGSGEIPQAFCRLSAVFGGTFALGQQIQGFSISDDKFKSVTLQSQTVEAEKLVLNIENLPARFIKSDKLEYISRCILITDRSVLDSEKEHLSLIFYPPTDGKSFTTVIEMGFLTGTCPNNLYLVHLIAKQNTSPQEDFQHVIDKLFASHVEETSQEKPSILWSYYFSMPETNDIILSDDLPNNIFVCPGPEIDLDYDTSVDKAKLLFEKMYPDLEFLPRAPDPEEIIIGDDNEEEESTDINEEDHDKVINVEQEDKENVISAEQEDKVNVISAEQEDKVDQQ
ncbi:unnamed protein product [Phyllotreta striolata]|uniref:Rab proteins geranylgeranyltransferase component A n=1 Tax=Phyllotreta striolata TaxID=444603 RepID=A0A9N9TES4_PHYSR|nr:unnamed protein product [Phyllotreta striolata]